MEEITVGWLIFFLFKEEKLLLRTMSTVAVPRQEHGPSSHSLPVLAEPPLLLSLSCFNTTEFILTTGFKCFLREGLLRPVNPPQLAGAQPLSCSPGEWY